MDKDIAIEDDLVRAAQAATGEADERVAVESLLRSAISTWRKNTSILDLAGKVEFYEGFDPKELRRTRYDPD